MKKLVIIGLSFVLALGVQNNCAAQNSKVPKRELPSVNKGPKNIHHGKRQPGDRHQTGDFSRVNVPSGGGWEVVNKGPQNVYHGRKDHKDSHKEDKKVNAVVYNNTHRYRGTERPIWAKGAKYKFKHHVYFPDYFTFFNPKNNNYIYWEENRWKASPNIPLSMLKAKFADYRIVEMKDVRLNDEPFRHFEEYYKSYPPQEAHNIERPRFIR